MKQGLLLVGLFALAGALTACGFEPVYGTHGASGESVAAQMNSIAIDNIPNRNGQILRNDLIDRMYGKGRPQQPVYHLVVKIRMTEEDLGIQANATSTRSMLDMFGDYQLVDIKGREVLHGTAQSTSSYNTLVDEYGNLSALNGATQRTLEEVSEQIVNRLSLYFAEKDEGHAPLTAPAPIVAPAEAVPVTLPNAAAMPNAGSQPAAAAPAQPAGGPMPDPRLPPTL